MEIIDLAKEVLELLEKSGLRADEKLAALSVSIEVLKVQPETL